MPLLVTSERGKSVGMRNQGGYKDLGILGPNDYTYINREGYYHATGISFFGTPKIVLPEIRDINDEGYQYNNDDNYVISGDIITIASRSGSNTMEILDINLNLITLINAEQVIQLVLNNNTWEIYSKSYITDIPPVQGTLTNYGILFSNDNGNITNEDALIFTYNQIINHVGIGSNTYIPINGTNLSINGPTYNIPTAIPPSGYFSIVYIEFKLVDLTPGIGISGLLINLTNNTGTYPSISRVGIYLNVANGGPNSYCIYTVGSTHPIFNLDPSQVDDKYILFSVDNVPKFIPYSDTKLTISNAVTYYTVSNGITQSAKFTFNGDTLQLNSAANYCISTTSASVPLINLNDDNINKYQVDGNNVKIGVGGNTRYIPYGSSPISAANSILYHGAGLTSSANFTYDGATVNIQNTTPATFCINTSASTVPFINLNSTQQAPNNSAIIGVDGTNHYVPYSTAALSENNSVLFYTTMYGIKSDAKYIFDGDTLTLSSEVNYCVDVNTATVPFVNLGASQLSGTGKNIIFGESGTNRYIPYSNDALELNNGVVYNSTSGLETSANFTYDGSNLSITDAHLSIINTTSTYCINTAGSSIPFANLDATQTSGKNIIIGIGGVNKYIPFAETLPGTSGNILFSTATGVTTNGSFLYISNVLNVPDITVSGNIRTGDNNIHLGNNAGLTNQGTNAIAIGAEAGVVDQDNNTIILNASGSTLNSDATNRLYIDPVRLDTPSGFGALKYNPTSKEITYDTNKTFVIDHPVDREKYLVHACLEGPESGVYYRGIGEILAGEAKTVINLPEYTARFYDYTVQLTAQINWEETTVRTYAATKVVARRFMVIGPPGKFFWHVTGKRSEVDVEPFKKDTNVYGDGPYLYAKQSK
jgi:hypothetical protein